MSQPGRPINRHDSAGTQPPRDRQPDYVERLRIRRPAIQEALFAGARDAVHDPLAVSDAEYMAGMRTAVYQGVDYWMRGMEDGAKRQRVVQVPPSMAAQAQRAVHGGVGLDAILRRCVAADRLMGEFVMDEVRHMTGDALRDLLRARGCLLDRLMATIAAEYELERQRARPLREQRRAEYVRRLLDSEYVDTTELDYNFDAWHLGVIAAGAEADNVVRRLAARVNRQLLSVRRSNGTVAAWLGGGHTVVSVEIERILSAAELGDVCVGIGEVESGIDGWRRTHRQAEAALQVALRTPERLARYGECALLATVLDDDTLVRALRKTYISPLGGEGDGGTVLIQTLRAYLSVGGNAATTAYRLGVDRKTVERRIDKIEAIFDRPLLTCHAELDVALRLDELDDTASG